MIICYTVTDIWCMADGQMDKQTNGWTDGQTDGRADGQADGRTEKVTYRGGCLT